MSEPRRELLGWTRWLLLIVPMLLAAWSAHAMYVTYSPTLYSDQWATAWEYRQVLQSGLSLNFLLSQHNEHRILFPRLVFLTDLHWFHGRNVLNLVAIGVIQLFGAAFYVKAAQLRRPGALRVLALAVALGLMFSLQQWENLFWGFQVQFVGVYVAGVWAIYLFLRGSDNSGRDRTWALVASAILLVIATYTMANGVFAGVAIVLVSLLRRRPLRHTLVAGIFTGALMAFYLHRYQPVAQHSPASLALQHPDQYVVYVLMYLGNIWGHIPPWNAEAPGLLGVALTLAMLVVVARDRGQDTVRAALLGVVLFIGMTAAATSLGRLSFGVGQALSSRYVTPICHFWAAQALFWALTVDDLPVRAVRTTIGLVLFAAYLLLLPLQASGQGGLLSTREHVLLGSSALASGLHDPDAIKLIYPDPSFVWDLYPFMRERRLTVFADPPPAELGSHFPTRLAAANACRGYFDALTPEPSDPRFFKAAGWGWDDTSRRAIERVVMTDSTGRVIGVGFAGLPRPDVRRAIGSRRAGYAGWVASVAGQGDGVTAYGLLKDGAACELGRKPWPK